MPNNCFPYPGNKARHAEWILEHIPEHECYVEPFGGAAGVLFNKPRSKVEVYNDLDGDIVHFFEVLRERCEELQEWLERVPYARQLYEEWAEAYYAGHRPDDDIERAGRFYALRYLQWGGKYDKKAGFGSRRTRNGAQDLISGVRSLQSFSNRLRSVYIESDSYRNVITRYDGDDTVIYADPPYIDTEYQYNAEGFDHRAFYNTIADCEANVLVSYDSIPPWYGDGWTVATKSSHFAIDNTNGDGMKDATEVLLMNFDANGESLMSGVGQQTLSDIT